MWWDLIGRMSVNRPDMCFNAHFAHKISTQAAILSPFSEKEICRLLRANNEIQILKKIATVTLYYHFPDVNIAAQL